jgi:thioredoxin 1
MKKLAIIFFTLISLNSFAVEYNANFTIEKFENAQNNGNVVIVSSWNKSCTTCAKQKPILSQAENDFKNVVFLNFEQIKNKDIATLLKIDYWTTIAVFKDGAEVARSIGLYKKDEIYSFIKNNI